MREFRGSTRGRWLNVAVPVGAGMLFATIGAMVVWAVGKHWAGIIFLTLGLVAIGYGVFLAIAWRRYRVVITPDELISHTPWRQAKIALREIVTLEEGEGEFVVYTERNRVLIPCIAIESKSDKVAFKRIIDDVILTNDDAHRDRANIETSGRIDGF